MGVGFLSRSSRLPRVATLVRLPAVGVRAALELVFPAACAGCGRERTHDSPREGGLSFCEACLREVALIAGPTCRQCGHRYRGVQMRTKTAFVAAGGDCGSRRRSRWANITGRLRELLLRMKLAQGNATSLAVGELMWHHHRDRLESLRPNVVAAVPMHWRRRWARGTNSAALLAEVIAARLGTRQASRLLRRRLNTPPQFSLPRSKRWQNVRQAFSVSRRYPIEGAHVLLIDDIMTTGATCSEAARMLKAAGAARVSVAVAARALVH